MIRAENSMTVKRLLCGHALFLGSLGNYLSSSTFPQPTSPIMFLLPGENVLFNRDQRDKLVESALSKYLVGLINLASCRCGK